MIAFTWIFTLAMFGAIIFGLIPYLDESTVPEIPKAITIIYGSLHRVAWSIGISWIIFACVRGYGGINIAIKVIHLFRYLVNINFLRSICE